MTLYVAREVLAGPISLDSAFKNALSQGQSIFSFYITMQMKYSFPSSQIFLQRPLHLHPDMFRNSGQFALHLFRNHIIKCFSENVCFPDFFRFIFKFCQKVF